MSDDTNELSDEKMKDIWEGDLLERRKDAEFLSKFLLAQVEERKNRGVNASYVLNVNAAWGRGKTFFLTNFAKQLKKQGYLVAEVNAWQDDHADDPFLSVMSAINETIAPLIDKKGKNWKNFQKSTTSAIVTVAKGAGKQIVRKLIGEAVDVLPEIWEGGNTDDDTNQIANEALEGAQKEAVKEVDKLIDKAGIAILGQFENSKKSINSFQKNLETLLSDEKLKDKQIPLFILIDELDRCRPTYAISMLERVKHLFDINNIIFVIATDTEQLQHSIKAVYGQGFDSASYLNRFFDRAYEIESPSIKKFVSYQIKIRQIDKTKLSIPPNDELTKYLSGAFTYFGFELRDIEQFFEILSNVITVWDKEIEIEMAVMTFYIFAFHRKIAFKSDKIFEYLKEKRNDKTSYETWVSYIPAGEHDIYGHQDNTKGVTAWEIFSKFTTLTESSLQNANNIRHGDWSFWVVDRLRIGHVTQHDLCATIKDYPEMIRTAGRLVSIKDETEITVE